MWTLVLSLSSVQTMRPAANTTYEPFSPGSSPGQALSVAQRSRRASRTSYLRDESIVEGRSRQKARSFRPPSKSESLSLACPRESNQKRGAPRLRALRASLRARSAAELRGLSTAHPVLTTNWFASMRTILRAFPPPARRFRRAPGRATRILRVLFRGARSKAKQQQSSGGATHCPCSCALATAALSDPHRVRATMARCSTGARQAPRAVAFLFG